MTTLDPRIRTAMGSIHPTKENPARHDAPTALGLLRGVSADVACGYGVGASDRAGGHRHRTPTVRLRKTGVSCWLR
jgi:hypothetical protein